MSGMIEVLMQRDILAVAVILAVLFLILIYRVVRGPHAVDRIAASCCMQVLGGIILILVGCYEKKAIFEDLGLVIILIAFLGNVLISKYLEGKL